jgi:hypothetical protein
MEASAAGLQSGFVLAVILLAVFFAERLGGSDELAKRSFQVVLGVALAFLTLSATAAFVRPPDVPESSSEGDVIIDGEESSQDAELTFIQHLSRRNSVVSTVHAGIGIVFAVAGLAALKRWSNVPVGFAIGGLLLVLFGGVRTSGQEASDPFSALFGAYSSIFVGSAGQARDIAHFAVLFAGTAALVAFGLWRWDRERPLGLTG